MNETTDPVPLVDAVEGDATPSAPKPARRRAAPKADAQAAGTEPQPQEATLERAAQGEEPLPKPRRRRTSAAQPPVDVAEPAAVIAEPRPAISAPEAPMQTAVQLPTEGNAELTRVEQPGVAEVAPFTAAVSDEAGGAPRGERGRRRSRRDRRRDQGEDRSEAGVSADVDMARVVPAQAGEVFAKVVSGEFDVEGEGEAVEEAAQPKRVLPPEPEAPKLHKVLAQAGIGSRRDMEELILAGHVTVNGETAHTGQRISFGDQVKVDGKPVRFRITPPPPRIIAYHKPVGEIVTNDDPQNRPTVFRRLPRLQQGKWQSVGRLDINTEGLLLFTNSGELANQLMHPRFGVEREYAVRVLGTLSEDDRADLLEGVDMDGHTAALRSIEDGGGEGANHWYRVVITEGRNREVRKLFDAVGLTVSRLIRIRYGTVVLPHGLRRGAWVDLEEGDVRAVRRLASGHPGPREDRQGGRGPQRQRNDRQGGRPHDRGRGNVGPPQDATFGATVPVEDRERAFDTDADHDLDIDHGPIPNPLEQTFDKRFVQNPRSPAGGRGFGRGGGGFGAGGSGPGPSGAKKGSGPKQPDPLQTSLGYIGADAFHRKGRRSGGGRGGFGGGGGGNTGGGGGGGGRRGR
jgi:23S rRNA pseudouridine2605 synthase